MKRNLTYLVLILITSLALISTLNIYSQVNYVSENQDSVSIIPHASSTYNTTIEINELPGNPHNWTWAKDQGICTGTGTNSDPFVIKNHFFDTRSSSTTGLTILNSRKHFRIENCLFNISVSYAGIRLLNTTNGYITENMNTPLTGALVWLLNCSYNTVFNNNASYCSFYGIYIDQTSHHNIISNNLASFNVQIGILLRNDANLNTIQDNIIHLNPQGIALESHSDNNTIKGNHISNNTIVGVNLASLTTYNILYTNCFMNNSLHARDNGANNIWDFGSKGNYWDNYTGADLNMDGIGDIPYNITGSSGSMDNFPLMQCPSPSGSDGIPGYELSILISGMLIGMVSLICLTYKKKNKILKY